MTKFFTNRDNNTLYNKLAGVFEHNKGINNFDILVGYFRASGYFKIRPLLNNIDNIRILVGIDVDEISRTMQQRGLALSRGDNKQTAEDWHRSFTEDIQDANYDSGVEHGVLQFIDDTIRQKVQVRAHPSRNIHAKIYIFRPDNFNEHNGFFLATVVGLGKPVITTSAIIQIFISIYILYRSIIWEHLLVGHALTVAGTQLLLTATTVKTSITSITITRTVNQ